MFGVGARQSLQADGRVGRAAAAEARLRGLAARQTGLQRAVQDQATRLRVALARQQALLAAADGRVRALAEEQRRQAEQQAVADFARRLADAQAAAARAAAAQAGADPGGLAGAAGGSPGGGWTGSLGAGTTPPNDLVARVIAAARAELGVPYSWGGGSVSGPTLGVAQGAGTVGLDCSGLTLYAYAQVGIHLPRVAADQYDSGPHPSLAQLEPGDPFDPPHGPLHGQRLHDRRTAYG